MTKPNLILGVGNLDRGDDGIGIAIARQLKKDPTEDWDIDESHGEPTSLMDLWDGRSQVIVIDAVVTGNSPVGTVHRWDATHDAIPVEQQTASSHGLGLADAIELSRVLGRLPKSLIIVGIESGQFDVASPLSPEVEKSLYKVVHDLKNIQGAPHA